MPDTDGNDWQEKLPEDIRSWDEVTNSDSSEKFWQQMTDMRSHLGQSIRIPSEDAGEQALADFNEKLMTKVPGLIRKPNPDSEEDMSLLYQSMGRPEAADKYTIPDLKTDIQVDMKPVEQFKPIAHKYGLTQRQFDGIIKDMTGMNISDSKANQETHVEAMQSLRAEWGLKFDSNMEAAKTIAKDTKAPKPLLDSLDIGTASKDTILWLVDMANRIDSESTNLIKDKTPTTGDLMTPAEAKRRINEIMNNREHPYWVKSHPQNKEAIQQVFNLQKMADPNASTNINDLRVGGVSHEGA